MPPHIHRHIEYFPADYPHQLALRVLRLVMQAAQALRETAQKPGGGTAATGVELGAGLGLGAAMAQMVTQAARPPATGAPAAPAAGGTPAVSANPTTPAEVQALLDSLDMRLAMAAVAVAAIWTLVILTWS